LGAGRRNTNDKLDYSVGIQIDRHVGDQVNKGWLSTDAFNKDFSVAELNTS
jgi:thymidine phosphorylase